MTQTSPTSEGGRRIDRILADSFLADLSSVPLDTVRARRREAEQEEADLSYLRRLLQGRIDILRAELARRSGESTPDEGIVSHLSEILADRPRQARGSGRFLTVEPSAVDERRAQVERVLADADLSDLPARSDEELQAGLRRLDEMEATISRERHRVQQAMDTCTAELGRRYRDGDARVDDLLPHR
jgi:hypothetical protein